MLDDFLQLQDERSGQHRLDNRESVLRELLVVLVVLVASLDPAQLAPPLLR